jgi:hypothetical protein
LGLIGIGWLKFANDVTGANTKTTSKEKTNVCRAPASTKQKQTFDVHPPAQNKNDRAFWQASAWATASAGSTRM